MNWPFGKAELAISSNTLIHVKFKDTCIAIMISSNETDFISDAVKAVSPTHSHNNYYYEFFINML